ncbi:TetR/AcrR family transcriptional regulator [Actinocorallia sp. A-T 12471]|uniref:TetR/AcrR family transcriptional regulator n=1 Tax=Actinocorallia sp. A-T 12471 TaxID=3089813 RepID=UPI0029CCA673|nr:TetR/AcrR family transcriptional regulator [Actinocorallia sp. A-T 12471]MDX6740649.1 TetR/AcrR family transcriptional regulator [Actinocorallia sp. A-T 12471]
MSGAGTNKRLAQGRRSRGEILDVASKLMAERGFAATSIADIARESGLPNSSIYWHFGSKSGILAAVMERGAERFFADAQPAVISGPPPEALRSALRQVSDTFPEHREFLRLFILLLLSGDDESRETVARVRTRGRTSLRAIIETAFQPEGAARAARIAEHLADYALAVFDGAFLATQDSPTISHYALMDQMAGSIVALAADVA